MEERSNFNFSRFMLQKPGKGLLVRNLVSFMVLIALIAVLWWMLTKAASRPKVPPQEPEVIEHVKVEL